LACRYRQIPLHIDYLFRLANHPKQAKLSNKYQLPPLMNAMKIRLNRPLFSLLATLFVSSLAFADSPLTSTDFAQAYKDVPIVQSAARSNGTLTEEHMAFLTDPKQPVDIKMALINQLGWDIDGKKNSKIFFSYLQKRFRYTNEQNFLSKGKGDELLAMAYLKALDNYFKVDDALRFAERALRKNKKSRTYALIAGLIRAQKAFDTNWCQVFKIMDHAKTDPKLNNDMRIEAIEIIFEYINLYESSCD
jgi:hypothetical protein